MLPIFTYQKLLGHIDGTSSSPSPIITVEGKTLPNPEAAAKFLGLTTARQIWLSLEASYSNASVERICGKLEGGLNSFTSFYR